MPPPLSRNYGVLRVVVQPVQSLRFRYKSESGKSTITGDGNKPWPAVRVENYVGRARLFASLVTASANENDTESPRAHPHILEGDNTRYGCYSKEIDVTPSQNTFELKNVQLVSTKINKMKEALEERERRGIDPYGAGFDHKERTANIDKNYVRICFQLAVYVPELKSERMLRPVCTRPIRNSNKKGELEIVGITPKNGPASGERRMIILMNGISKKEDLKGVEFTDKLSGSCWNGKGLYTNKHIYELSAITMVYPKYEPTDFPEPAREVEVRLVTAQGRSRPVKFVYLRDNPTTKKKRNRKVDLGKSVPEAAANNLPSVVTESSVNKHWSDVSSEKSSGTGSGQPLSSMSTGNLSAPVPVQSPSGDILTQPKDSDSAPASPKVDSAAMLPAALENVSFGDPSSTSRSFEDIGAVGGAIFTGASQQAVNHSSPVAGGFAINEGASTSQGAPVGQMVHISIGQQPEGRFHHVDMRPSHLQQLNFVQTTVKPWGIAGAGTQTQYNQPAKFQSNSSPKLSDPQPLCGPENLMTPQTMSQPEMTNYNQDEQWDVENFDADQAALNLFENVNNGRNDVSPSLPYDQTPVQSTSQATTPQQPMPQPDIFSLPADISTSQSARPKPAPRVRVSTEQTEPRTPPQPARRRSAPVANTPTAYGHQHNPMSVDTPSTASTLPPELDADLDDVMDVIQDDEQQSQTLG